MHKFHAKVYLIFYQPLQEKEEINDELAKIEAIEIEFVQFVLPWLKLVPPDSCWQNKVYYYIA